jgi:predicted RNA-binding Zn ribbon-like protein
MPPVVLPAAPGDLLLVQRFVNSVTIEDRPDRLRDTASTLRWLQQNGDSIEEPPSERERLQLLELRELLAALLRANAGEAAAADVLERVNTLAAGSHLAVQIGAAGATLGPLGTGGARMIGRLMAIVYNATQDGSWRRLKVCASDTCGLAYWDASRNRSATWCSMAVCGNREKVRRYQRRQASARREAKA